MLNQFVKGEGRIGTEAVETTEPYQNSKQIEQTGSITTAISSSITVVSVNDTVRSSLTVRFVNSTFSVAFYQTLGLQLIPNLELFMSSVKE
jgi:hypothetical protein